MLTHLVCALERLGIDDRLRQHWIHRELCHPSTQSRQLSLVVQGAKSIEHFETPNDRLRGRFVQEIKVEHIVDSERFQHQHHHAEIGSLYLRYRILQQLVPERPLGVQSECLSWPYTTSTTSTLLCRSSRDWLDDQRRHSRFGVVVVLLDESWINDVDNTVDGDRCLGDVGSEDDLAGGQLGMCFDGSPFLRLRVLARRSCSASRSEDSHRLAQ